MPNQSGWIRLTNPFITMRRYWEPSDYSELNIPDLVSDVMNILCHFAPGSCSNL